MYEVVLDGPRNGNPFVDVQFTAHFTNTDKTVTVHGFYDGNGTYRIRFMPESQGEWRYVTESNRPELAGKTGKFTCVATAPGNHGPVRVRGMFHFAYADGTPFVSIGTTCYNWANESDELRAQTVATLKTSPFNKVRMCVLPTRRPRGDEVMVMPFPGPPTQPTDVSDFDVQFFQRFDECVKQLGDLNIQADVILLHPYAQHYWSRLSADSQDRYVRYVVARLASYRNVWWSLANEFDFIRTMTDTDWDRLFQIVQADDPYNHLRSIHNGAHIYDPFKPSVTHLSVQNGSVVDDFGRAVVFRQICHKPIVFDEVRYEGNLNRRWGQLSGEEMVRRFWFGAIAGTYVTHGEALDDSGEGAWTGRGGRLLGESPKRIAFLRDILSTAPADGLEPIDQYHETHMGGKPGEYYLVYFGREKPTEWPFQLPAAALADGMQFHVDVLDTWNMTITPVDSVFTAKKLSQYQFGSQGDAKVHLPGREYMALRIKRVHAPPTAPTSRSTTDEQ